MMTAARELIYFQSLQNIRFSQLSNGVRSYGVYIMYVFKGIKKSSHIFLHEHYHSVPEFDMEPSQ